MKSHIYFVCYKIKELRLTKPLGSKGLNIKTHNQSEVQADTINDYQAPIILN